MVVVKTIKHMYTSTSLKLKLQVQKWSICLNIRDLRCDVGVTIYTLVQLELEICAFVE